MLGRLNHISILVQRSLSALRTLIYSFVAKLFLLVILLGISYFGKGGGEGAWDLQNGERFDVRTVRTFLKNQNESSRVSISNLDFVHSGLVTKYSREAGFETEVEFWNYRRDME